MKHKLTIIILLIISTGVNAEPDLSNLITILENMDDGNWEKVNLNLYSDTWAPKDQRPLKGGKSNPRPNKIIRAWSGFAWDSKRGDLIIYGGGHANYSGNDVYRWRGTTQLWERASLPSEIMQDDLGNWMAIDGVDAAPASAHTYDNNIYLPIVDRFLVFGGAAYNNGNNYKRQVDSNTDRSTGPYLFDPSKADANKVGGTTGSHVQREAPFPEVIGGNMWENRDIYINIPGNPPIPKNYIHGATGYLQENGKDVVYVSAREGSSRLGLYKYVINDINDPTLDTIEKVGRFSGINNQGPGAYDPVRKQFIKAGRHGLGYWNLNTPGPLNNDVVFTPFELTGELDLSLMRDYGLDYNPLADNFAIWNGTGAVWILTPPPTVSPDGWILAKQPVPTSITPPIGSEGKNGILGKWKFISNFGAFIALENIDEGNIWLYKPVGWQNPTLEDDTDGDGLPDGYEIDNGLDPNNPSDATGDLDSDGISNLEEFQNGTNPNAADVIAPVINPQGGTFNNIVAVTLSTSTANAEIYYTTDGTSPNISSTLYSEPFDLTLDTTVRAIGILSGFTDSLVNSADFTVVPPNQPPIITSVTATPQNLFDTQSSQLEIIASDPDDSPQSLSYIWSVQSGNGTFDDPTVSDPIFSPPDVTTSTQITVTVMVSDSQDTVSQLITLTVEDTPPLLHSNTFDDINNLINWTIIDEGSLVSPSQWSVINGALNQTSNIRNPSSTGIPDLKGSYIVFDGGNSWTDYRTTYTTSSSDDDDFGIMFRVQDTNNYYRFSWNSTQGYRRLVKNINGVFTTIFEDNVPYIENQVYSIETLANNSNIEIRVNGSLIFSGVDSDIISGSIAFYTWANSGASFDNVIVEGL